QSPLRLGLGHLRSVCFLAQEHERRIAGSGVNQQEDEQADEQQNGNGSYETLNEITRHFRYVSDALGRFSSSRPRIVKQRAEQSCATFRRITPVALGRKNGQRD